MKKTLASLFTLVIIAGMLAPISNAANLRMDNGCRYYGNVALKSMRVSRG